MSWGVWDTTLGMVFLYFSILRTSMNKDQGYKQGLTPGQKRIAIGRKERSRFVHFRLCEPSFIRYVRPEIHSDFPFLQLEPPVLFDLTDKAGETL